MIIERLKIKGYKRFKDFEMDFNKRFNVIIGDNESGKSTVLEAIDIVMNQKIFNFTDSNFEQYFNNENKEIFFNNPVYENLPEIEIELFFAEKNKEINNSYFSGHHSSENKKLNTGISFTYKFNDDFRKEFEEFNFDENNAFIPTDYYLATWETFAGKSYVRRKRPMKMLLIDGTKRHNNLFNSYSRQVFNNKINEETKSRLSHSLKENFKSFIEDNKDDLKTGDYTFGIDDEKAYIEHLIDLKADDVSLQHKGKGMESLIKTYIALENESDIVLIEEPENHLSHTNTRELVQKIRDSNESSQVIMTTHSPLVVSRMNLTNTIWIRDDKAKRLIDIPKKSEAFFRRTDNMDILSFILSDKAILVEGHSEYILVPKLIKNTYDKTIDEFKFNVFSGSGLTYKHFIEVSKVIENKLLVITDNDKKQRRIDEFKLENERFKKDNKEIKIVCDQSIENWTFEVCLYNENRIVIEKYYSIAEGTEAEYENEKMPQKQAYMLKNKTLSAMKLAEEFYKSNELRLPEYIKGGIEWLNQN